VALPDGWAGSVVNAIVEGQAGVKDLGSGFDRVAISPRWAASGDKSAQIRVRYPASVGYVAYNYDYDEATRRLHVKATSSASETFFSVLLPSGRTVSNALVNRRVATVRIEKVENSIYAHIEIVNKGPQEIELELL